jgi:acetyl esterase/lipase
MRPLVAAPPAPWDIHPKNIQEWKELVAKVAGPAKTLLPAMREKLGVQLEPITIAGVKAFVLTPRIITPENQNRVFLHFHGGAYVLNPGEPGTREATLMAAFGQARVISVDYRTSSELHIRPRSMTALLSTGSCSRPFRRKTSRSSAHQLAAG